MTEQAIKRTLPNKQYFKKYKPVKDLNINLELGRLSDDLNCYYLFEYSVSQRPARSCAFTGMSYHITTFYVHSVVKWKQL